MNTPAKCRYAEQHLIFLPSPVCRQLYSTDCSLAPYLLLRSAEQIPTLLTPLSAHSFSPACHCLVWCLRKRRSWKEKEIRETSGYIQTSLVHCAYICIFMHICVYLCIGVYIASLCVHQLSHQLVHSHLGYLVLNVSNLFRKRDLLVRGLWVLGILSLFKKLEIF